MKKNIMPVVALFLICVAVTALVACANAFTEKKIKENAEEKANQSMRRLISQASEFNAIETSAKEAYSAVDSNGNTVGYIFITVGTGGYGGDITVMTAIDADGIVTGIEITEDDETQGLGKNAHSEVYRSQYAGKKTDSYTVVKGSPSEEGDIQALTGATKTSKAVTEAVNLAKQAMRDYMAGGGQ